MLNIICISKLLPNVFSVNSWEINLNYSLSETQERVFQERNRGHSSECSCSLHCGLLDLKLNAKCNAISNKTHKFMVI